MRFFSILGWIVGLTLTLGGGYLLSLGGSAYYLIAGIVLLITSGLAFKRQPSSLYLYSIFLLGTFIWALSESGYYWWGLAPRLGLFLAIALPLFFTRSWSVSRKILVAVWTIITLVMLASLINAPFDKQGELPMASINANTEDSVPKGDWNAYGRSNLGQRYSPLEDITPDNIANLKQAWVYRTGDMKGPKDVGETTYEATPLKVGNSLYLCTPHNWLVALDADSGEKRWVYDSKVLPEMQRQHQTCRGVSYQPPASGTIPMAINQTQPSENLASVSCDAKLFLPTSDARLIALDPVTGARCQGFGDDGVIDLTKNMPFKQAGYYYSTSPPLVSNGFVVVGGSVNDNYDVNEPSGVIRAYNTSTGELAWNWDSGNPDETAPIGPNETYAVSSPNSWSIASADDKLGLIYLPMGNSTPDQLGMYRSPAEEKYATSVVALHIETGKVAWVQQFIHHDLWDMDTPAQPSLLDLQTKSGLQPALVVPTKQGDVYVLNRKTGEPIIPITEQPAPQGTIPEDYASPTQPSSALNFKPEKMTGAQMWGATPIDQLICRIQFKKLRYEGQYTPPSIQGTLVYPGNFGVFNWGGVAVDPERQVMFAMPLDLAFVSKLIPNDNQQDLGPVNTGEQGVSTNTGSPYSVSLSPFLSPLGIPCQQPPWGSVAGVNLRTGEKVWQHKNGTTRDMTALPLPIPLGMPGIGGPIITKGGVAFMAASLDDYLRGYDLKTGQVLWTARLPAGGQATPMTYLNSKGEQMVVQVAGGHGSLGTTLGDYVVAYKLEK
ncbi:quinoprotein glucose dehydrogenase [Psychromonas ingrahamii 37]|uniref:Quinoprotein glucose dehydrogenase n=1 Tax=Psychromonas ingrahamii (strain DSM 17664 / CCUG 51855 / 37) TaxID=357804 RepID=A1SZ70_PSYIN|nr:glucose/quinate/shikimate family membrane-bound PQQ-dependent dehydrogenase [Psychromonas ingrahamii]ABM04785.1 quinoprotein glucose dehydrogenase [Psychromonas ingrahamii 37]